MAKKAAEMGVISEEEHQLSVHRYPPKKQGDADKLTVELVLNYSGTVAKAGDVVKALRDDADTIVALAGLGVAGEVARTLKGRK